MTKENCLLKIWLSKDLVVKAVISIITILLYDNILESLVTKMMMMMKTTTMMFMKLSEDNYHLPLKFLLGLIIPLLTMV